MLQVMTYDRKTELYTKIRNNSLLFLPLFVCPLLRGSSGGCQWKESGGRHSSASSRGSQRHWAGEGWHLPGAPCWQAVELLPSWPVTLSIITSSFRQCTCCWRRVIRLQTVSMLPWHLSALRRVLTAIETRPRTKSSHLMSKTNQSTAF